ncbi:hypothetical protein C8J57DRAFT_1728094, partial [Mycena rebaudengoi]
MPSSACVPGKLANPSPLDVYWCGDHASSCGRETSTRRTPARGRRDVPAPALPSSIVRAGIENTSRASLSRPARGAAQHTPTSIPPSRCHCPPHTPSTTVPPPPNQNAIKSSRVSLSMYRIPLVHSTPHFSRAYAFLDPPRFHLPFRSPCSSPHIAVDYRISVFPTPSVGIRHPHRSCSPRTTTIAFKHCVLSWRIMNDELCLVTKASHSLAPRPSSFSQMYQRIHSAPHAVL